MLTPTGLEPWDCLGVPPPALHGIEVELAARRVKVTTPHGRPAAHRWCCVLCPPSPACNGPRDPSGTPAAARPGQPGAGLAAPPHPHGHATPPDPYGVRRRRRSLPRPVRCPPTVRCSSMVRLWAQRPRLTAGRRRTPRSGHCSPCQPCAPDHAVVGGQKLRPAPGEPPRLLPSAEANAGRSTRRARGCCVRQRGERPVVGRLDYITRHPRGQKPSVPYFPTGQRLCEGRPPQTHPLPTP